MNARNTIVVFLIAIPFAFYAGMNCQEDLSNLDEIGKPLLVTVKFQNNTLHDTLYLVSKRWGYTGDHQLYALTANKPDSDNWIPDSLSDYVWKGDNTIYYQQKEDTVKIWTTYLPAINFKFKTKQIIQITQIDNITSDSLNRKIDTAIRIIK